MEETLAPARVSASLSFYNGSVDRVIIYALYDRREPYNYRYVGMTSRPLKRLWAHRDSTASTRAGNWTRHVRASGSRVEMTTLETLPTRELAQFREAFWIAAFREAGYDLTNHMDGWLGRSTGFAAGHYTHSPETLARMSATMKAKKIKRSQSWTPEMRTAFGELMRERHRQKLAARDDGVHGRGQAI